MASSPPEPPLLPRRRGETRPRRAVRSRVCFNMQYTFQEEYRILLKKYHVEFDERYVWD